jgi:sulfur-carrier protein
VTSEPPADEVTVTVRLFARARDLAGCEQLSMTLPTGSTIGALRAALLARHPALEPLAGRLLAALNADYVTDTQPLTPHAEVAFFPPVSGG